MDKLQLAKDCLEFYANGNNYLQPTIETTHKDGYIGRAIPNAKTPIEREGWGRKAKECLALLQPSDAGQDDVIEVAKAIARSRGFNDQHISYANLRDYSMDCVAAAKIVLSAKPPSPKQGASLKDELREDK